MTKILIKDIVPFKDHPFGIEEDIRELLMEKDFINEDIKFSILRRNFRFLLLLCINLLL